ncbi:MAG: HD domain-containing protein [Deltaproteobacteria bacterium]|nr:HD domain-containing protein [Deltaproteobacteria bacterium]
MTKNGSSTPPPSPAPRLYNSRILQAYLLLIRSRYSHVNIQDLLAAAGMKLYEVEDEGQWFTQEQINRFYERLVQLTGNPHIAREAGRYAASPDSMGVMRKYVLGMIDLPTAYAMIRGTTANFTRSSIYESKKLAPGRVEITVTPCEGVREEPFQCQNRIGFFEAIGKILTNDFPRIEHDECLFRGGKVCRYTISWQRSYSALWRRIRNLVSIPTVLVVFLSYFLSPQLALSMLLPGAAILILTLSLFTAWREKREIQPKLDNIRTSTQELLDQVNINYNNVLLSSEIGYIISRETDINRILEQLVQALKKYLAYDRGLILLADPDQERLKLRAGFGYEEHLLALLRKITFGMGKDDEQGLFTLTFREQKPVLVNDIDQIEEEGMARALLLVKELGVRSCICCPIVCEDESLGVLLVEHLKPGRPLVQNDLNLLMGIAPIIGVSIRNAERLDRNRKQFSSTIQVLAASIECRDPYTAGHSEKVTEYALGICRELGLPEDFQEMIRVAALLHDYGKIGVPDAILKKPGRLSDKEYETVKTHAAKTREILERIHFEGIYREVPAVAGAHHEKIDGSGYPLGRKGAEIPLGAKIIAVADFFEAITSQRFYREPMPLREAFRLLEEKSGVHFEKRLVDALLNHYRKTAIFSAAGGPPSGPARAIPPARSSLGEGAAPKPSLAGILPEADRLATKKSAEPAATDGAPGRRSSECR